MDQDNHNQNLKVVEGFSSEYYDLASYENQNNQDSSGDDNETIEERSIQNALQHSLNSKPFYFGPFSRPNTLSRVSRLGI